MKLANRGNRVVLVNDDGIIDIADVTEGAFGPDPHDVLNRWGEFTDWTADNGDAIASASRSPLTAGELQAPVPRPRQVFGIGLNYRDHAEESGMAIPDSDPVVFAKFPTAITGPHAEVEVTSDSVDFETEVVVVIGEGGYRIAESDAWGHVAGLTMGQDISDRTVQLRGPSPQFSLGKSFPGFAPIGPVIATPDEIEDLDAIRIGCDVNGSAMQDGSTENLIFTIPQLIAALSEVVHLLPGDLIFTGTPAGIGWARDPKISLKPGDVLTTYGSGIGEIKTTFIERAAH